MFMVIAVQASRTVARKSSLGGLYVRVGGFDIENLIKSPMIYSTSYFDLGGGLGTFVWGAEPTIATGMQASRTDC